MPAKYISPWPKSDEQRRRAMRAPHVRYKPPAPPEQTPKKAEPTTTNRKDDDNMKEFKTAADFIDALNDIFSKTRQTYDTSTDNLEKARRKMEQASEDTRKSGGNDTAAQARYFIAKGEFQLAEDEARRSYEAMIVAHNKQVGELREKFVDFLGEHYAASPDKLDAATMQLLGTGICTPAELERLAVRHQSNPTMLRILGAHAKEMHSDRRNMTDDDKAACLRVRSAGYSAKDGSRELEIFDAAVSTLDYGLGKDAAHAARMATHAPGWMDGYKNRMNNLPVIPEEMAPASKADSTEGGNE